ncbi:MAG: hypothetical protein ACM3X6_02805 [Patescibacteria group bacterium]
MPYGIDPDLKVTNVYGVDTDLDPSKAYGGALRPILEGQGAAATQATPFAAPARASLTRIDTGETVEFLANPHIMSDSKAAEYDRPEVAKASAPPFRFKFGGSRDIAFSFRLIARGNVDAIEAQINTLRSFTLPAGPNKEPPAAMFVMGQTQLKVRVMELRHTVDAWTPGLRPRDVTVDVALSVDYGTKVPKQPKPGSKDSQAGRGRSRDRGKVTRINIRGASGSW